MMSWLTSKARTIEIKYVHEINDDIVTVKYLKEGKKFDLFIRTKDQDTVIQSIENEGLTFLEKYIDTDKVSIVSYQKSSTKKESVFQIPYQDDLFRKWIDSPTDMLKNQVGVEEGDFTIISIQKL